MRTGITPTISVAIMMLIALLGCTNTAALDMAVTNTAAPNVAVANTAASSNLPLIVIADTQMCQRLGTVWTGHRSLIEHINSRASKGEIAAIVTAGDSIADEFLCSVCKNTNTFDDQWYDILTLLAPARSALGESKVVYVPGNHEHLYDNSVARAEWDTHVKPLNLSVTSSCASATGGVRGCGSFDTGDMHVAFLNIDRPQRSQLTNIDGQLDWLESDLESTSKPWKIVVFHYPSWGADVTTNTSWWRLDGVKSEVSSYNDWQIEDTLKKELHTIFKNNGVRLVINGHRHAFNVFVKDGIHYVTAPTATNGFEMSINPPCTSFHRAYTQKAKEGSANENQVGTTTWAIAKQGYLEIQPSGASTNPMTLKVYVKDANGNVWTGPDIPYLPLTIYYPPVAGVDVAAERTDPNTVDFYRGGYRYEYRSLEGAFYLKTLCTLWDAKPVHPPLTGVNAAYDKDGIRYFYTYDDGDPDAYGDRWTLDNGQFTYTDLYSIWGNKGSNAPPLRGIDSAFYSSAAQRVYFFGLNGAVPTLYTLRVSDLTFEAPRTLLELFGFSGPDPNLPIDAVWRKVIDGVNNTYYYQGGTRWTMQNGTFTLQQSLSSLWANKPVNPDGDICLADPRQCTCAP